MVPLMVRNGEHNLPPLRGAGVTGCLEGPTSMRLVLLPPACPICHATYRVDAAGRIVVSHDFTLHHPHRHSSPVPVRRKPVAAPERPRRMGGMYAD